MIVFGVRLFGKAEIVPGVFFIATRFFHICFIPLIPVQSFIVFVGDEGEGGAALPSLHWGSISMAWLRGLLLVGAVVLGVMAWNKLEAQAPLAQARPMVAMAALCVVGFFGSYRTARATAASLDALKAVDGVPSHLLTRARDTLNGSRG